MKVRTQYRNKNKFFKREKKKLQLDENFVVLEEITRTGHEHFIVNSH